MSELASLKERAKELRCLYAVHAAVAERAEPPHTVFLRVLGAIPEGWQRPDTAGARIEYLGRSYVGPGWSADGQRISAPILLWRTPVGTLEVSDLAVPPDGPDAFLAEERQLLQTIARRLGEYLEWKHTQLLGERLPPAPAHWRWRQRYVEALVHGLEHERFGPTRVFLGGSTESGEAGPGSDIDLFVLHEGTPEQLHDLELWLDGWSRCLAELALQQTGYDVGGGLLDVHYVGPDDVARMSGELRELQPSRRLWEAP
jgi:hypothetical protein